MADNSDYTKPYIKLFELLPEVYKSDTNKALFANLFGRYLTKQETERVAGYIGEGNPNAIVSRQIHEPTVHRQAYQLQPILYNKIGSVEWMASWKDILNEAERQGIDPELIQEWMSLLKFNWAPPIDIDKLIHFQDYYWYDADNPSSQPQYITIRSRCYTAEAYAAFHQRLVDEFGAFIPISELKPSTNPGEYDTLVVDGDYGRLFEENFVFFITNSTNTELNNTFRKVKESDYEEVTGKTTIVMTTFVSDPTASGDISLQENLNLALIARNCQCDSNSGWDALPWDDNPDEPSIWNTGVLYTDPCGELSLDFDSWLAVVSYEPGVPNPISGIESPTGHPDDATTPPCGNGQMWYDVSANVLYQYHVDTGWKVIQTEFSLLLAQITGTNLWDLVKGCGVTSIISTADQWIEENRWMHKLDVPNFSIAKQASVPIIEYDWDLELNEWTVTEYEWKYRASNGEDWAVVDTEPDYIEATEILAYDRDGIATDVLILDDRYGDLTDYFTPGRQFLISGVGQLLEVLESTYSTPVQGQPKNTRIQTTEDIVVPGGFTFGDVSNGSPADEPLRPVETSRGDSWKGAYEQWLLTETETTKPMVHQTDHPLSVIDISVTPTLPDPSGNYWTAFNYFAQYYEIRDDVVNDTFILDDTLVAGTSKTLQQRAMKDTNNVRVYVNEIRQYGNYIELSRFDLYAVGDETYVAAIQFLPGFEPARFDEVLIQVGEATMSDGGRSDVSVRTIESDTQFLVDGTELRNIVHYRKEEQVKTQTNQYPLFDIYRVDGSPANKALPIFEFVTDPDADVNIAVGLRLKEEEGINNYVFKQNLLEEDNGVMFAYRDYYNQQDEIWVDTDTNIVYFWTGKNWDTKIDVGGNCLPAYVSDTAPATPIDGQYWLDLLNYELKVYDMGLGDWEVVPALYAADDPTLQTIWKKGLNDEKYVPEKVDWDKRSFEEYTAEKDLYVEEVAEEILASDPTLSIPEAEAQAEDRWFESQSNHLSTSGAWVGDWELPDPLYYNHSHENRVELSMAEVVTHFSTIIDEQPKVPAFNGPRKGMFHLIPSNEVNWALGGTIREYQHGFDTFLSSLFVNEVSPRELIGFAHDQYEVLLNSLKEIYRSDALDLLASTSEESLTDQSAYIVQNVIDVFEQNDNLSQIYGDTTAFTNVPGGDDIGVRNWIATLPFFCLAHKQTPVRITDYDRGLNHIVHHDGHREDYFLADATIESLSYSLTQLEDPRVAPKKLGIVSTDQPPNTVDDFEILYDTPIGNREGVYWYHRNATTRVLYRLAPITIGFDVPDDSVPNGSMWLDLNPGQEALRVKQNNEFTGDVEWVPPPGITPGDSPVKLHNGPGDNDTATVSAWQVVDLNEMLRDIIFEVETRLYEAAPTCDELVYDLDTLSNSNPAKYNEYLEEQFLAYARELEITTPYSNTQYDASNPFSWNYKYSTHGTSFQIIDIDTGGNAFIVDGDFEALFNPCVSALPPAACGTTGVEITFYVKNNGPNDGKWTIVNTTASPKAVYDAFNGYTRIFVDDPLENMPGGVIYLGLLPASTNTGAESGGDWRDVYQKFYGTPFPHLEPWALQGYRDKPTWWDEHYLNDDPRKWGDRRWKYKHGFDIVTAGNVPGVGTVFDYETVVDPVQSAQNYGGITDPVLVAADYGSVTDPVILTSDRFTVAGDFREVFNSTLMFTVDGGSPHDGVWTVDSVTTISGGSTGAAGSATIEVPGDQTGFFTPDLRITVEDSSNNVVRLLTVDGSFFTGPPDNITIVSVREEITDLTGYDIVGGATYDEDINETVIRVVEDVTIDTTNEGRIAIKYGMWHNILIGRIPPATAYPNGVIGVTGDYQDIGVYQLPVPQLPTYNYMSVNIGNDTINSGGEYLPDEVFPPYWDFAAYWGTGLVPTFDRPIRSLFYLFTTEIVSPGADYVFADAGPVEWLWRESSQFLYDQLIIAFRSDPIKFIYSTFGSDFYTVGGLLIDKRIERVLTHVNADFHGDLVDNELLQIDGINQWYVNFLRHSDFDISMSDFRSMWSLWTAPMMYQFASFVDTPSLDVGHRQVCVSEFDYRVEAKRSPGVEDSWLDSFNIDILSAPPKVARHDNEYDWKLSITTKTPFNNNIDYYDVQKYQFFVDPATDLCTLYSWLVVDLSFFNDTFSVSGNQTHLFTNGRTMDVVEATTVAINGTYTIRTSAYNQVDDVTIIEVEEDVASTTIKDGRVILNYRSLPWATGENVVLSAHRFMPTPLQTDNINGVYEYFIIRESSNTFRLATTRSEAENGSYVDVTSPATNDLFVAKVLTTFNDGVQPSFWKHYALDTTNTLTFTPPYETYGLQNLINIIDGYEAYTKEEGWRYNIDNTLRDPSNTAFAVNWQHECIRFLQFAYQARINRGKVEDRYLTEVDVSTDVWTLPGPGTPQFITGDPVTIYSSNGVYPTPLVHGGRYYMIRDSITTYRLAATRLDARSGTEIDIVTSSGVGDLYLMPGSQLNVSLASFEINPFRNAVWFRPERGVVSNMLKGPTESFSSHILVDQYGRAITQDIIRVYREDKETKIAIEDGVFNDVELTSIYQDPYNFIHLGACHLFIDTYEHVLIFNDETTEGQLLYDSFLGLNITKFELLFNRQIEFTQRPNVGGQYLSTFFNQGADLARNIEASVEDLRNLYDTFRGIEANKLIAQGRKSIGYEKEGTYLDNMNLNDKSQFVFWRGQIQHKGAMTAIQAFINSRRFIDAKIDEYWAVKTGEFGSNLEKEYIEMWLTTEDAKNDDMFLQFIGEDAVCDAGYSANPYDSGCGYAFPNSGEAVLISDEGWTPISITDDTRWVDYPDQIAALRNNAGILYFDLVPLRNVPITIAASPPPVSPTPQQKLAGWIDITAAPISRFYRWDDALDVWLFHGQWDASDAANPPILRHDMTSDLTTVTATVIPSSWPVTVNDDSQFYPDSPSVADYGLIIDGVSSTEDYELITDVVSSTEDHGYLYRVSSNGRTAFIPEYVPGTGMIQVFRGPEPLPGEEFKGTLLEKDVDYAEIFQGRFYSNEIVFNEDVSGDIIRVVYGSSTFTKGIHYELFNTNIVQFLYHEMADPNEVQDLRLWGWFFNKGALNPHSVVDTKSETVVSRLQLWDPARGVHYYNADHIIDLRLDIDPAFYTETLTNDDNQRQLIAQEIGLPIPNGLKTAEEVWGTARVGTTFMKTRHLNYVPYYDPAVIEKIDDRLLIWGQLAGWSDLKIWTWVESDVHPSEWNDLAASEEGDLTIPQQVRKSGRTFETIFKDQGGGVWLPAEDVRETFDPIIDDTSILAGDTTFQFTTTFIDPTLASVSVFVNGQVIPATGWAAISGTEFEVYDITVKDRVDLVDFVPGSDPLLDDETNQANLDAAITAGTHAQDYQYSTENYIDNLGVERLRYYFWVEDKATKGDRIMSPLNAQTTMVNFPNPYVIYDDVIQAGPVTYEGESFDLPARFQRAVLRGLRSVVDDNNRYMVRWTRDFTLRDQLGPNLARKNLHEQWEMIRREMPYHVPRWLWDKVTESIVGYLLDDPTTRVPSYQRELYDIEYETDTQYGLGEGQAFTDGELALATILADLNNPDNDFTPIDINVFFTQYSFDTPENIIAAMDNIYNNFPYIHVNRMFFDCLLDAFSKKGKYEDIFKTSMIAVHGIRPFQVGGLFDD